MTPWLDGLTNLGVRVVAFSVLLLSTGCSIASSAEESSTALEAHTEDLGQVCAPTDEAGTATIAWEHVTNVSDAPVTIRDIVLSEPQIKVIEWATFPLEWPGGVLSGDQLPTGEGSRQVAPGDEVQLAMVVQLDGESQPAAAPPTVKYRDGDGVLGSLDLAWSVTLGLPGEICQVPDD